MISSVRGSTLLPGTAPSRSNSNSQAVIEVSGSAAACANDSDFGLRADDALVDQVKFRVGALAQDRAGVEHFVARLEQRDIGADGIDNAGGVVAQDFGFALGRGGALADLVVDRVRRDRLHGDSDVTALRLRLGGLEIDQRIRVLDREATSCIRRPSCPFSCLGSTVSDFTVALASIWQVL